MARQPNRHAIRTIREAVGLTQRGLARRAGIGNGTVSAIEAGDDREVRPDTLRKIADALGAPLDAISTVLPEREDVAS